MLYKKYDLYEKYGDFDKYEKKPVFIYLFCHDDLDEGYRPIIYRDYLKDLMYELEQVFQREIIVELHYAIPGVTDFSYKTELGRERSSLDEFASRGATFAQENDLSYRHNYRYGLITQDGISSSVHGMAWPRLAGIFSWRPFRVTSISPMNWAIHSTLRMSMRK